MLEHSEATRRTAVRAIAAISTGALTLSRPGSARATAGTGSDWFAELTDQPERIDVLERTVPDRSPSEVAVGVARRRDVYVAAVDRIVDGAHVVLLLEAGGELVDQHVASRDDLPDVEEGDTLVVVIADGELTYAREIESNAIDRAQNRFECLATSLDG